MKIFDHFWLFLTIWGLFFDAYILWAKKKMTWIWSFFDHFFSCFLGLYFEDVYLIIFWLFLLMKTNSTTNQARHKLVTLVRRVVTARGGGQGMEGGKRSNDDQIAPRIRLVRGSSGSSKGSFRSQSGVSCVQFRASGQALRDARNPGNPSDEPDEPLTSLIRGAIWSSFLLCHCYHRLMYASKNIPHTAIFDDFWLFLIIFDDCWWFLIILKHNCVFKMIKNNQKWSKIIKNIQKSSYYEDFWLFFYDFWSICDDFWSKYLPWRACRRNDELGNTLTNEPLTSLMTPWRTWKRTDEPGNALTSLCLETHWRAWKRTDELGIRRIWSFLTIWGLFFDAYILSAKKKITWIWSFLYFFYVFWVCILKTCIWSFFDHFC